MIDNFFIMITICTHFSLNKTFLLKHVVLYLKEDFLKKNTVFYTLAALFLNSYSSYIL